MPGLIGGFVRGSAPFSAFPLATSLLAGLAGSETSTYCAVGGAHHAGPESPFLDAMMRAALSHAKIFRVAGDAFSLGIVGGKRRRVVWGGWRLFDCLVNMPAVVRLVAWERRIIGVIFLG